MYESNLKSLESQNYYNFKENLAIVTQLSNVIKYPC